MSEGTLVSDHVGARVGFPTWVSQFCTSLGLNRSKLPTCNNHRQVQFTGWAK